MPILSLGLGDLDPPIAGRAVRTALQGGWRGIDTAPAYQHDEAVRHALAASRVPRDELFVASKIWTIDQARHATFASIRRTLESLALDYLDLCSIHWPAAHRGTYVECWEALVHARELGLVRSVGVCNFGEAELDAIIDATGVTPVTNQIEMHPHFQQRELRRVNAERGIRTVAWRPFGAVAVERLGPELQEICARTGHSPEQVSLAWLRQSDASAAVRSTEPQQQAANLASLDIVLDDADMLVLAELDRGLAGRLGPDPELALI